MVGGRALRDAGALSLVTFVLALMAWTSAVAQAAPFFNTPEKAVLKGESVGPNSFTSDGIAKECKEVRMAGRIYGSTPVLVVEPVYEECSAKALSGMPAKFVEWNCTFSLHDLKAVGRNRWKSLVDLGCTTQGNFEWIVYETEAAYKAASASCATSSPSQTDLEGAELTDKSGNPDKITIHWDIHEIAYKAYGWDFLCGSRYGVAEHNASFEGTTLLSAVDTLQEEKPIDLTVRNGG